MTRRPATTTLRVESLRLPAADIGPESPLPQLTGLGAAPDLSQAPADIAAAGAYGRPHSLLPYRAQQGYGRDRRSCEHPTVVLENETLTATFLPGLGGRLWSLHHRARGRELLHRNPVLQPANLALRNAWVAGGVEWNLGATGHWPLTCAPLHAVELELADGTPMLRMYEFERLRRLVLCVDAWLPAGSPVLLVRISVRNPTTWTAPVYWWSNIAVPEAPDVRVLAPADHAYHFGYHDALRRLPFPVDPEGADVDRSYTTRATEAADYFFDIPAGQRHWISALDGQGSGLVQVSTDRLVGRKLFHWGTGPGGRRWQEWLSGPDSRYLEIQAGLARTQLEHLPLPAGATWEWAEAYGLLEADPARVHGPWSRARREVDEAVEVLVPARLLREAVAVAPTSESLRAADGGRARLADGSGWGALETAAGVLPVLPGVPFGEVALAQRPWLELLLTGRLPVSDPPADPVTGENWRRLLEEHPADWHARYHLGLLRYADGDAEGARSVWEESRTLRDNAWAARCLGRLAADRRRTDLAADLLLAAHELRPEVVELTIETVRALLEDDRPRRALALLDSRPVNEAPRLALLEARAAVAAGEWPRARALLDAGLEVPDLKEGENSLDALWRAVYPTRPLPHRYDFRMHQETEAATGDAEPVPREG